MAVVLASTAMSDASKGSIHSFFTQPRRTDNGSDSQRITNLEERTDTDINSESARRGIKSTLPCDVAVDVQDQPVHNYDGHQRKKRKISGETLVHSAGSNPPTSEEQGSKQDGHDNTQQFEGSVLGSTREQALSRSLASGLRSLSQQPSEAAEENQSDIVEPNDVDRTKAHPTTPPAKMLKLNAKGTLGSPTSTKNDRGALEGKSGARKGRKKKEDKHLLARCRYAQWPSCSTVGPRITRILQGQERFSLPAAEVLPAAKAASKPSRSSRPAKSTHPFFVGKPKDKSGHQPTAQEDTSQSKPSPRKSFASTPGKIRMEVQRQKAQRHELSEIEEDQPRKTSSLGYVVWPSRDMMHVRGVTETINHSLLSEELRYRKKKYRPSPLDNNQSILRRLYNNLKLLPSDERRLRSDGFYDPPSSLRLPRRLLITGLSIQGAVSRELSRQSQHAALMSIYRSIEIGSNPYDEGRSEPNAWVVKYAPKNAEEVLQSGSEATILRDWMKGLTVMSVEMKSSQPARTEIPESKPRKKRRKRAEDLDDFIVDDENDIGQLEEVSVLEDSSSGKENMFSNKRTLIRSNLPLSQGSNDARKIPNAVVISGPNGCGKTAMVYAVAKELGFQVFEINSGTRRSGKDVLERVGDMVENHLVSRQNPDAGNVSADEDSARLSKALTKDLESGRQGTMNTFFKPKAKTTASLQNPKPKKTIDPIPSKALSKPKTGRNQKQSVILLEEVDVLFEQDKNFWNTVLELIVNSKRPVVITSTNENVVPLQAMSLHAILRLSAPSHDIAADYLLLMAAREGHLLRRDAVSSLLRYKKHDLRASISELQFWCQMGVGDPRGGLSWMFQRWPPGTGLDSEGRVQRVVSEGAYPRAIGCIPTEEDSTSQSDDVEELLLECWENWQMHPFDDLQVAVSVQYESEDLSTATSDQSRFNSLKAMDGLFGSMSAFDVCCMTDLPQTTDLHSRHAPLGSFIHETKLDPTQALLSEKARQDYVVGSTLLQTDEKIDYTGFDSRLATSAANLLSQAYGIDRPLMNTDKSHLLSRISNGLETPAETIPLSRHDFSAAFDPISEVAAHTSQFALAYSAFDGPLSTISEDIAPYVRSIVHFDLALEEQRTRLSSLLGGSEKVTGKRSRTTRAARSALEGGKRETTRRERWFPKELDLTAVLATGGKTWPRAEMAGPRSIDDGSQGGLSASASASAPGSQVERTGEVSAVPADT